MKEAKGDREGFGGIKGTINQVRKMPCILWKGNWIVTCVKQLHVISLIRMTGLTMTNVKVI